MENKYDPVQSRFECRQFVISISGYSLRCEFRLSFIHIRPIRIVLVWDNPILDQPNPRTK